jgi:hypothetical protein
MLSAQLLFCRLSVHPVLDEKDLSRPKENLFQVRSQFCLISGRFLIVVSLFFGGQPACGETASGERCQSVQEEQPWHQCSHAHDEEDTDRNGRCMLEFPKGKYS